MKSRLQVFIPEHVNLMLRELAAFDRRTISAEVEVLIRASYRDRKFDPPPVEEEEEEGQ